MWPVPEFFNGKHVDLVPFSAETLSLATQEYTKVHSRRGLENSLEYWKFVYENYAAYMIPFYTRLTEYHKDEESSATVIPTTQFPWSLSQMKKYIHHLPGDTRLDLFGKRTKEESIALYHEVPFYNFQNLTEIAIDDVNAFEMVKQYRYTQYVPWQPRKILHFLWILLPEEHRPFAKLPDEFGEKQQQIVRLHLLRYWKKEALLRQYVGNLIPEPLLKQKFVPVAPLEMLIYGYASWTEPIKELAEERLANLWASNIIERTYRFYKAGDKATTYSSLMRQWLEEKENVQLCMTPVGLLFLFVSTVAQLDQRGIQYVSDYASGAWNNTTVIKQIQKLLNHAIDIVDKKHKRNKPEVAKVLEEQEEEEEDNDANNHRARQITAEVRNVLNRMKTILNSVEAFLTLLFNTLPPIGSGDRPQFGYRLHLSFEFLSIESLKKLYLENQKSVRGRTHTARRASSDRRNIIPEHIVKSLYRMKVINLKTLISTWVYEELTKEQDPVLKLLVHQFDKETRLYQYDDVPLMASSKQFQRYIYNRWKRYQLEAVSENPNGSSCHTNTDELRITGVEGKSFLLPDRAQQFMHAYFRPSCFANGQIIVHSVGSGKTCLSIMVASEFARAGYRIVWVTKTSLRNQVYKNHVGQICNLLIRREYERLLALEGDAMAKEWLTHIPKQTSVQSVLHFLHEHGMEWVTLSYRQLSNALEAKPRNKIGRAWNYEANLISVDKTIDPLRHSLLIFDEAHKMFTGELDRTELPNVPVIKAALQSSFQSSGDFRCRVLFLTATPTPGTILPLFNMVNMLHAEDVFPYEMQTINPDIHSEHEWMKHAAHIREENRRMELQASCVLFPLSSCPHEKSEQVEEEEEEDDAEAATAYFDARAIVGTSSIQRRDLRNNLEEFWRKTFGLISVYNISHDYSKFPRTEFKPIILPSCSFLQERLMAAELTSPHRDLKHLSMKIRQIAAWAMFQSVGKVSRKPSELDELILRENAEQTYFEPTVDDLQQRMQLLQQRIQEEEQLQPDPKDLEMIKFYETKYAEQKVIYDQLLANYTTLIASRSKRTAEKGQLTKGIRKASEQMNGLQEELNRIKGHIEFFETEKRMKIKYFEKHLKRLERKIEKLRGYRMTRSRVPQLENFLKMERVSEMELEVEEEEEEEEVNSQSERKRDRQKKKKQIEEEEEEEDDEEEMGENWEENKEEMHQDQKIEEKIAKGRKAEEYFTRKTWFIDRDVRVPNTKPKIPKKHHFDQPETFDKEQFRADMSLYSPKLSKLMEVMDAVDKSSEEDNPEVDPKQRLRKHFIFCEDLYSIRAVAGGLVANGWTFGMKLRYVRWRKTYYEMETNKVLGEITSKARQLTWLPSLEGGSSADYKRFLILTRSKIGGISGATLNEYAVQLIGSKDEEATYNHQQNGSGQMYRVILIDRNFLEGIDLPSTFGHLYDSVLAQSTQTQIVGRISRFCGHENIPFVPHYGWPQVVYRYGLKFHTVGLHFSERQIEKLQSLVHGPLFSTIIPEKFREAFVEKLEKNLFSPVELQVLLDDNMEIQRIKKKTLDVYNVLTEKVSIGALLYEPAMRNLQKARTELDELLLEEEETQNEYKQEVFNRDKRNKQQSNYLLRSQTRKLQDQWQMEDGGIMALVRGHVMNAFRRGRSVEDQVSRWESTTVREHFFNNNIKPDLADAEYITFSETLVKNIMNQMLDEKVREFKAVLEERQRKKEEKEKAASRRQLKRMELEYKRQEKRKKQLDKDIRNHILMNRTTSRKLTKNDIRKMSLEDLDRVYQALLESMPHIDRLDFDRVVTLIATKHERKSRRQDSRLHEKKPKLEISRNGRSRNQKENLKKSRKGLSRKRKEKVQNKSRRKNKIIKAIENLKKDLKMDKRNLKKNPKLREELLRSVKSHFPSWEDIDIQHEMKMFLFE